jgi:hypothetical protein
MDEKAALRPHAPSRVDLRAVGAGVGIMVGGVALAIAGAWIVSGLVPSPRAAPNNAERPRIAGPVQRTAPALEREAFLREKAARLHGRGIDPASGEPFIPIDEAMREMTRGAPRGRTPP